MEANAAVANRALEDNELVRGIQTRSKPLPVGIGHQQLSMLPLHTVILASYLVLVATS